MASAVPVAVLAAYILLFLQFAPPMLQDYPNHIARALVVGDLLYHGGARFGTIFQFHFMAVPYVLNDLVLASAIELFGVDAASIAWNLFVFLSLPCALLCYMRVAKVRRNDQVFGMLAGIYLASNSFFFRGFLAFSLALAVLVGALALGRLLRQRFSPAWYLAYCVLLAMGYLVHLTTLVFILPAMCVSAALQLWRRSASVRTEALLFLPIVALLLWHFGVPASVPQAVASAGYHWGTIPEKIRDFGWPFIRFEHRADLWMLWIGILCLLWQGRHLRTGRAFADPPVIDMLALAITFLGIYMALPLHMDSVSWVDVRALPMVAIFALLACLVPGGNRPPNRNFETWVGLVLATLLVAVNLVYVNTHLRRLDTWLAEYRAVVAAAPAGAWLLPVYTNTRDRPIKSTLHAAAFAVIDRGAPYPYLFSADLGNPEIYFRYKRRPYSPDETWYVERAQPGVEWDAVRRRYDFLLVMKPFDPVRIPIATTVAFENAAAALLAIDSRKPLSAP